MSGGRNYHLSVYRKNRHPCQEPSNFSTQTKRSLEFCHVYFTVLEKLHSREYPVSEGEEDEGKEEGGSGR